MTNKVLAVLADNQIRYEKFRTSLTNRFHLVGLTVNGAAEHFPKKKFVVWYAKQVTSAIQSVVNIDDINPLVPDTQAACLFKYI